MAYEENAKTVRSHSLTLDERHALAVTGVEEVISFDEEVVTARTVKGILIVRGSGLKVGSLDKTAGRLGLSGQVTELCYEEDRTGQKLWSRLFR